MEKPYIEKLKKIPHQPGCYFWKNKLNEVIYIGKAKNLSHRTHSYFAKNHNSRTQKMVNEIYDLDYLITTNENEALLLESDLVYKHKPKYNVLLRNEKNKFPYLFLSNEPKPRLFYTKDKIDNLQGEYFGPFASSNWHTYDLYKLLTKILPIQDCKHKWNAECFNCEILKRNQIKILEPDQLNFENLSKLINKIFLSEVEEINAYLKQKELAASQSLQFLEADKYLKLQDAIKLIIQSNYVKIKRSNMDVIAFAFDDNFLVIVIFSYVDGKLIEKHEKIIEYLIDWNNEFISYIWNFYQKNSIPKEVLIGIKDKGINDLFQKINVKVRIPKDGELQDILNNAINNAKHVAKNKIQKQQLINLRQNEMHAQFLNFFNIPDLHTVQIFDISQFFGDDIKGGMLTYKNGERVLKLSRKFNLKDLQLKGDVLIMKEILLRWLVRFSEKKYDQNLKPDLIIVDGGIAHYNIALEVLETLDLVDIIYLCALEKDDHHKTNAIIFNKQKTILNRKSLLYAFFSKMQDEVHNYVINSHNKSRVKSQLKTIITTIPGIGEKRYKNLMEKYNSIEEIYEAEMEELKQFLPEDICHNLKKEIKKLMESKKVF